MTPGSSALLKSCFLLESCLIPEAYEENVKMHLIPVVFFDASCVQWKHEENKMTLLICVFTLLTDIFLDLGLCLHKNTYVYITEHFNLLNILFCHLFEFK